MSRTKVIILLIITILGLLCSLALLSMTFDMNIPVVNSICHISDVFDCEVIAQSDWANIFDIPQSILTTTIYLGLLIFFVIGLFIKEQDIIKFMIIPFIVSIFMVVYSAFLFVYMYILTPAPYGLFNTIMYAVNIALLIILIIPYLKSLSESFIELFKTPLYKNFNVLAPIAIIIVSVIIGFLLPYLNFYRDIKLSDDDLASMKTLLSDAVYEIDTDNAPVKGENKLGLEIVVFEDFQCPACRNISKEVEKLMDYYNNEISLIFKHYPLEPECFPLEINELHPLACEASYASLAAKEQDKFWEYYELLFSAPLDSKSLLETYAKKLDLDMEKFEYDYNSERIRNIVKKDTAEGHYSHRITGTPTFFFNGRKYNGSKRFESLRKVSEFLIDYNGEERLEQGKEPDDGEEQDPVDVEEDDGDDFNPEDYLSEVVYDIETENSPVRGKNEIGVELIVFEDFQCPACRRTAGEIHTLMEHFDYEISLIFKHYPLESECFPEDIRDLHEYACEASYASLAAKEQGKFWEYYDLLYSGAIDNTEVLFDYAEQLDLNMDDFSNYYESEEVKNIVMSDTIEGYEEYSITSTPSLFFNGRLYKGPKNSDSLIKLVDYLSTEE